MGSFFGRLHTKSHESLRNSGIVLSGVREKVAAGGAEEVEVAFAAAASIGLCALLPVREVLGALPGSVYGPDSHGGLLPPAAGLYPDWKRPRCIIIELALPNGRASLQFERRGRIMPSFRSGPS